MTNKKTIEQHRAEFEAWFSNGYKWLRRIERHPENSSCYAYQEAGIAWQAWLAARGAKESQE